MCSIDSNPSRVASARSLRGDVVLEVDEGTRAGVCSAGAWQRARHAKHAELAARCPRPRRVIAVPMRLRAAADRRPALRRRALLGKAVDAATGPGRSFRFGRALRQEGLSCFVPRRACRATAKTGARTACNRRTSARRRTRRAARRWHRCIDAARSSPRARRDDRACRARWHPMTTSMPAARAASSGSARRVGADVGDQRDSRRPPRAGRVPSHRRRRTR